MSRPRQEISDAVLSHARFLRKAGFSWKRIGQLNGYHEETIRRRLDKEFEAVKRFRYTGPLSFIRAGERRVSPDDAERALAGVPSDTRSRLARFMGDPMPGRSALDQKSMAARVSPTINTTHTHAAE